MWSLAYWATTGCDFIIFLGIFSMVYNDPFDDTLNYII